MYSDVGFLRQGHGASVGASRKVRRSSKACTGGEGKGLRPRGKRCPPGRFGKRRRALEELLAELDLSGIEILEEAKDFKKELEGSRAAGIACEGSSKTARTGYKPFAQFGAMEYSQS